MGFSSGGVLCHFLPDSVALSELGGQEGKDSIYIVQSTGSPRYSIKYLLSIVYSIQYLQTTI